MRSMNPRAPRCPTLEVADTLTTAFFNAIHNNGNIFALACGLAGIFFFRCFSRLGCCRVHLCKAAEVVDRMPFSISREDGTAVLGVAVWRNVAKKEVTPVRSWSSFQHF